MSEKTGSRGTFYVLVKWFRWASLIIILAPIASLIFGIIDIIKNPKWVQGANDVLAWVTFIAGIIWFILIIVLFFTAGRVKDQINALWTRIWLLIALACVLAPAIVAILASTNISIITNMSDATKIVIVIALPIIEMIGYIIAAITAGRAKRKLG